MLDILVLTSFTAALGHAFMVLGAPCSLRDMSTAVVLSAGLVLALGWLRHGDHIALPDRSSLFTALPTVAAPDDDEVLP